MNRSTKSITDSTGEMDALLRSFFRFEMPSPWPTMARPSVLPASRHAVDVASRLALAASIALLLLASFFLADRPSASPVPNFQLGPGEAAKPGKLPIPPMAP